MHALTIGRANPVSQPIELPTTYNERSTPAPNEWAAVSIGINLPPRFASECLAPVLARAHDRSRSVVLLLAHHQLAWSRPPFGERFHRDGEHGEFLTCLPSFFWRPANHRARTATRRIPLYDHADRVDGNRVRTSGRPCRASRGNAAKEQELAERTACPRGPAAPGGNLPAQGRHRGNIPARGPSPTLPSA